MRIADLERVLQRITQIEAKINSLNIKLSQFNKDFKSIIEKEKVRTKNSKGAGTNNSISKNQKNRKKESEIISNFYNDFNLPDSYTKSETIKKIILKSALRYGLDPYLISAIIKAESDFNHNLVSKKGAIGLMQLMPETAEILGIKNPFLPKENIEGGSRYFKKLFEQFNGDLVLSLAAYNAGPTTVRRYNGVPPYKETKNFIERVLSFYSDLSGKL